MNRNKRTAIGILFTFLFTTMLLPPVTALEDSHMTPPLNPVAHLGQPFPLSQLLVIVQTSQLPNADTDSRFRLNLMRGDRVLVPFDLRAKPWDETETGRTDTYQVNLGQYTEQTGIRFDSSMFTNSTICISLEQRTRDDWLPNRIWIMGRNANSNEIVLLAYVSDWSSNRWFARTNQGITLYSMNLNQQPC